MNNISQKQRNVLVVGIILIAILVTALGLYFVRPGASSVTDTQAPAKVISRAVRYTAEKGKTVLAQLREVNDTVVTKKSSYGPYVDSLNGLKGGDKGKYWTFYIDGKMASVGADTYTAKGGEEIVWRYQ